MADSEINPGILQEKHTITQYDGEPFRRWFWSERLDLTVWYDEGDSVSGFQLCYKDGVESKALTWKKTDGFTHDTVDEGDADGGHKRSPLLVRDGVFPKDRILKLFIQECGELPGETSALILEKLAEYE